MDLSLLAARVEQMNIFVAARAHSASASAEHLRDNSQQPIADFNAEIQLILGVPLPKTISVPVDAHATLLPLSDEPV